MKYILSVLIYLSISIGLFAQLPTFKAGTVSHYDESTPQSSARTIEEKSYKTLSARFKKYDIYNLDTKALGSFIKSSGNNAMFSLEFGDKYNWEIDLRPETLLSKDYKAYALTANGKIEVSKPENITYKGTITNQDAKIRMTVDGTKISCFITVDGKKIYVEQLNGLLNSSEKSSNYVIYDANDVKKEGELLCQSIKDEKEKKHIDNRIAASSCSGLWQDRLATYATFTRFSDAGGVTQVNNEILTILNNVQGNYDEYKVKLAVVEQEVATCATCEPWSTPSSPNDLLTKFTNWGPTGFSKVHDEGICFFKGSASGVVGVAWVGAICTNNRYCVVDKLSSAERNRQEVAHEMGHNFGAQHDASGSPYIMAPFINGTTVWSDASKQSINSQLSKQTCFACISDTLPKVCSAPSALTVSGISGDRATLNWNNVPNVSSYKIQYRVIGDQTWIEVNQASNSINLTGLKVSTTYEWQVSTTCTSSNSGFTVGPNFTTTAVITPPPVCAKPEGLNVQNLQTTSVTLSWNAITGVKDYTVQVRGKDSVWQSFTASSNSININGLLPGVKYEWQVKSNCTDASSDFTGGPSFTTNIIKPDPSSKLPWTEDFTLPEKTTVDNDTTKWTSSILSSNNGYAEVRNGQFTVSGATAEWIGEKIFFGSATAVKFSTEIRPSSNNTNNDIIKISYRFDDNAWSDVSTYGGNVNRVASLKFSGTVKSVQIKMTSTVATGNTLSIDNVKFRCASNCPAASSSSVAIYTEPTVELTEKSEPEVKYSPNPFAQSISIDLNGTSAKEVDVVVYNSMGNIVYQKKGHQSDLPIVLGDNFTEGVYFVKISSPVFNKSIKIIKIR